MNAAAETSSPTSATGNDVAAAAALGQAELAIEKPVDPLAAASGDPASAPEAGAPVEAAFTREDLNAFARELVTFGRQMLAPKRGAWDLKEQELDNLGRTGGALLDKYMPADLGPYTVEIAFGVAVVASVTRAARDDGAELRKLRAAAAATPPPGESPAPLN